MEKSAVAALASFALLVAACGGDAVSLDDVSEAERRWEAGEPDAFHWRADGTVDGRGIDVDLIVSDGEVETAGSDAGALYDVDGLFEEVRDALGRGVSVRAEFDDELGYPTRIVIGDEVDLTTRDFVPIPRTRGCDAQPGSIVDLDAEPATWLMYTDYHRWTDADGCEVRVDVIGQYQGPEHCGWEAATFIDVGTPLGSVYEVDLGGRRTFIWDPAGSIELGTVERDVVVDVSELPPDVIDTGFRDGDAELWVDEADPTALYRVANNSADRFALDQGDAACM